jgi:hypothetical protein
MEWPLKALMNVNFCAGFPAPVLFRARLASCLPESGPPPRLLAGPLAGAACRRCKTMIDFFRNSEGAPSLTHSPWARLAVLLLVVAALGLPIDTLFGYALLLIATVLIFSGQVILRGRSWLAAAAAVAFAALLPLALAPIAQGLNVFLPGKPGNVLARGLPAEVYRFMTAEFDALYPPAVRCTPTKVGCWIADGLPRRLYAFSADGVFQHTTASRNVRSIDFSNPVWLRLGFVNDKRYNWYTDAPDVHRGERNRPFWAGLHRWRITLPWFMMLQFPADDVGGKLCWPGAEGHYRPIRHATSACRAIRPDDVGRKIFAVAIRPGTLAMSLHPPVSVQARLAVCAAAALLAVIAVLMLLMHLRLRDTLRPFALIGLALLVIAVIDASFIGGWRPMDGGDDGLFYTGTGRQILQHLLDGNIAAALIGGEKVYYYGGPGLRYFRALEMILFGDSNLGYLSLVLLMPIIVLGLFKRFLSDRFAWTLALVFTALPAGEIFGTSFFHYAKWAARGFADPAAHILLLWGLWVIVPAREGAPNRARLSAGGALLLALAVFTKPLVAPIVGIVLGGAGLAALVQRQWRRLLGLCIGFLPVLLMPLHNWVFGHKFVLLSTNAGIPSLNVMPPSAYAAALRELLHLDFGGAHLHRALVQIGAWLSEPSQLAIFIPVAAAGVLVVAYVTLRGRDYDPWLRLLGGAVLAECAVDLVYAATPRYYFSMWLLAALVVAVVIERRFPALAAWPARWQKVNA